MTFGTTSTHRDCGYDIKPNNAIRQRLNDTLETYRTITHPDVSHIVIHTHMDHVLTPYEVSQTYQKGPGTHPPISKVSHTYQHGSKCPS